MVSEGIVGATVVMGAGDPRMAADRIVRGMAALAVGGRGAADGGVRGMAAPAARERHRFKTDA
jgi:hypothetical protein